MDKICEYVNRRGDSIRIYFDEEHEELIIINRHDKRIIIVDDLKNMNFEMLEFIAKSFKYFDFINSELFYITKSDVECLQDCQCINEMLEALAGELIEIRRE